MAACPGTVDPNSCHYAACKKAAEDAKAANDAATTAAAKDKADWEEAERKRKAEEERKRKEEEERKRKAAEEAERKRKEEEERQRKAAEEEARRKAAEEAERKRKQEEEDRKKREAEHKALVAQTAPVRSTIEKQNFFSKHTATNLILDIENENFNHGAHIILYGKKENGWFSNNTNQQFYSIFSDEVHFKIVVRANHNLGITEDGSHYAVLGQTADISTLQLFGASNGSCNRIQSYKTHRCLSSGSNPHGAGTKLIWETCDANSAYQEFCWDKKDLASRRSLRKKN